MTFRFKSKFRFTILLLLLSSGCGYVYRVETEVEPLITLPNSYHSGSEINSVQNNLNTPWWETYNDPYLSELITASLKSNLSMQIAWERMLQVSAQKDQIGAGQYPSVTVSGTGSRISNKTTTSVTDASGVTRETQSRDIYNSYSATASLSYQIDLWNRTESALKSGEFRMEASRADVENTALILSGSIADTYLRAQELQSIIRLLSEQITASEKMLKLTKYRFGLGQSSALDVYQQDLQLTAIKGELPLVRSELQQIINNLSVLTGREPSSITVQDISGIIPKLPKLPKLGSPVLLLESRPDLRALKNRVTSSSYDIAAAYADKFPSIDLSLSYSFNAQKFSELLKGQLGQILKSIVQPVFDGGRRDSVVEERESIKRASELEFNEGILRALRDVENALIEEREQLTYLENVNEQLTLAEATLRESRKRYLSGATDYLQVTIALQALQSLQRTAIASQARVIYARNRLYLALGGEWTKELSYQRGKE